MDKLKFGVTVFKNIYDNNTSNYREFFGFKSFEKMFYDLAMIPGRKPKKGEPIGEGDSPLISSAYYKPGTTRSNDNVVEWQGWVALDVDSLELDKPLYDKINDIFGEFTYICYSTPSSRVDQPKFRIVLPFDGVIKHEKIQHFWYAVNTEFGNVVDKQTKDLSRMFYVPGRFPDAYDFIFTHHVYGGLINPDYIMSKHPYSVREGKTFLERLPKEIQEMIIARRKDECENVDYKWMGIRDCPFWPKDLEMEYRSISGTGWYHKMYQIMVSIAGSAVSKGYPITTSEIVQLCRELDSQTGNWYKKRPLNVEADRAIEFVYRKNI